MCKCANITCSFTSTSSSKRRGFFYLHSASTRVVLFVLRWLRGSKLQGDGEVGSLLLFQFELSCYELINLCGGRREAAAQPDWIVFSRLCLNFAWCPPSWAEPPVTVHNGAEFEFAKKFLCRPVFRIVTLLCCVCCREWVWSSRVAGFPQGRERPELPLCTAPVWPVGRGTPPLQPALRLRPGHEPNGGQVRLAGCLTRKNTSQLHSFTASRLHGFRSFRRNIKTKTSRRQRIIRASQPNSGKFFRSYWVHIFKAKKKKKRKITPGAHPCSPQWGAALRQLQINWSSFEGTACFCGDCQGKHWKIWLSSCSFSCSLNLKPMGATKDGVFFPHLLWEASAMEKYQAAEFSYSGRALKIPSFHCSPVYPPFSLTVLRF